MISELIEFEWDNGNRGKNLNHDVTDVESEEVFFDTDKVTFADHIHSNQEESFRIIGKTKKERLLFVAFTVRMGKIRIISARDINKKEVCLYEKKTSTTII